MKGALYGGPFVIGLVAGSLDDQVLGPFFWFGMSCYLLGAFTVILRESIREGER